MFLRLAFYLGAVAALAGSVYYQLYLKEPFSLASGEHGPSTITGINNGKCSTVTKIPPCEKMVLHHPTNSIFFACSTSPFKASATNRLNVTGQSFDDWHIGIYNLTTGTVSRLKIQGFPSDQLVIHGFDVVSSKTDPSDLLFYLVNRRPQGNSESIGPDSVIEMFKMRITSDILKHVKTFGNPAVIITPYDVYGHGDGSFYFTNDYRSKRGVTRIFDFYFRRRSSSVGYCHVETGCKLAAQRFNGANAIVRGLDNLYFVANHHVPELYVLERQADNTLLLTDIMHTSTGMSMDNISVDEYGNLFIATSSKKFLFVTKTLSDPIIRFPSAVLRLSRNSGPSQYYGQKFNIEKVFQDDGSIASSITTALWSEKDKYLLLSGVNSLHVTTCRIEDLGVENDR